MLFSSYEFVLLFLPIVLVCLFVGGGRSPRVGSFLLVAASLFFYGWWDVHYVPLLFASIVFNYVVGGQLARYAEGFEIAAGGHVSPDAPHVRARKGWLFCGIVVNLLLLGYFKYMDFFLGTVNALAGADVFDLPHIVLPLGISFYTFTQTAYLIDAYRGCAKRHSFLTYLEFVTIFPHLIAGPIINYREMMPQFLAMENYCICWDNMAKGLALFSMGLFKKVVIADELAPWVQAVFSHAGELTFFEGWAGALGYTLQLYFDFSGYSEMAIGLGLMLNLHFPQNFDSPYQAKSIIDFWRRWHMTLGLWVKEYLYIPLGGNRAGQLRKLRNLFVSMVLIGLWHGAGWTFVAWGAMHGLMLMVNHVWRTLQIRLPGVLCWVMTFLGVMVCWVFFRAADFQAAVNVLAAMTDVHQMVLPEHDLARWGFLAPLGVMFAPLASGLLPGRVLPTCLGLLCCALLFKNPVRLVSSFHANWKWFLLTATLLVVALYKMDRYTEFLYFQF